MCLFEWINKIQGFQWLDKSWQMHFQWLDNHHQYIKAPQNCMLKVTTGIQIINYIHQNQKHDNIPVKLVLELPTPAWWFGRHLVALVHKVWTYYQNSCKRTWHLEFCVPVQREHPWPAKFKTKQETKNQCNKLFSINP